MVDQYQSDDGFYGLDADTQEWWKRNSKYFRQADSVSRKYLLKAKEGLGSQVSVMAHDDYDLWNQIMTIFGSSVGCQDIDIWVQSHEPPEIVRYACKFDEEEEFLLTLDDGITNVDLYFRDEMLWNEAESAADTGKIEPNEVIEHFQQLKSGVIPCFSDDMPF